MLHALATGTYVDPHKSTVGDYLLHWLENYAKISVAPRTFEGYEMRVRRHLVPALGSIRLTQLRPAQIAAAERSWLESGGRRGEGLSPRSVVHNHRVLREALGQAVKWQLLAVNPADAVTPPRVERQEMRSLSAQQSAALLDAAQGSEFGPAIETALYTGLRLGELLGLRWEDLDLHSGRLSVQQTARSVRGGVTFGPTKTHRSRRRLSIPATAVEGLRGVRAGQLEHRLRAGTAWHDSDLVFTDALGHSMTRERLRAAFYGLLETAGLPRVRLHDLRHTHATLMLSQGEHPKVVSERLGHATVGITLDTYSHVLPDLQAEAAERLAATLKIARDRSSGP